MAMLGEVRTEEGSARVAASREFIRAAGLREPGCPGIAIRPAQDPGRRHERTFEPGHRWVRGAGIRL
jgi:hypothetical protein